jgi:hypothetical protein
MPSYVVFTRERMRDTGEYEIYREKSRAANAAHELKALALYGGTRCWKDRRSRAR